MYRILPFFLLLGCATQTDDDRQDVIDEAVKQATAEMAEEMQQALDDLAARPPDVIPALYAYTIEDEGLLYLYPEDYLNWAYTCPTGYNAVGSSCVTPDAWGHYALSEVEFEYCARMDDDYYDLEACCPTGYSPVSIDRDLYVVCTSE